MSDHLSDRERREDDELTRLSAALDAAELRDAERDHREQEKELAEQPDPAVRSARR